MFDAMTNPKRALIENMIMLFGQQRFQEVAAAAQEFTRLFPDHSFGWKALGGALKKLGQTEAALEALLCAASLNPNDVECHRNLAVTHRELGHLKDAENSFRSALELAPNDAMLLSSMGTILYAQERLSEAEQIHRRALTISPNIAEIHLNLATTLFKQGSVEAAIKCYQSAITLKPDYWLAWTGFLFCVNYSLHFSAAMRREYSMQFGEALRAQVASTRYTSWPAMARSQRLRIGIVSGDLYRHPVGYFLQNVVACVDQTRYEVFFYANQSNVDSLTKSLQSHASSWCDISQFTDIAAAARICDDQVQVLIDLSGHTLGNRLPVFAMKPAPVAISWLGYFATTGLREIDYVMADAVCVPAGSEHEFCENVWQLPDARLCFSRPTAQIDVSVLPAQRNGFITFGCMQNVAKLNDRVLSLWAQILSALPSAKLRIQNPSVVDPVVCDLLEKRMLAQGIPRNSLSFHSAIDYDAYLQGYSDIDIVLDTFPFPGGTTTCEALLMGVPTLSLAGESMLSRQGASLLTAAKLTDWIANSEQEYFRKAVAFAADIEVLAWLRCSLRAQVSESALFDARRFARNWEDAIQKIWAKFQSAQT